MDFPNITENGRSTATVDDLSMLILGVPLLVEDNPKDQLEVLSSLIKFLEATANKVRDTQQILEFLDVLSL